MANLGLQIEEIIDDVNKIHLKTLRRAAEISPLVNSRTIGPDIVLTDESDELSTDGLNNGCHEISKHCSNEIIAKKSPQKNKDTRKISKIDTLPKEPNSLHGLDFQTINASMLLKIAEEQRKRSLRQEVVDFQQKRVTFLNENLKPIQEKSQEERRRWLEKKRRTELQILQQAEEQTVRQLNEYERQMEGIRSQTQKRLQLVAFQGISQYQSKFRNRYEAIVNLLLSIDKQALISCAEYNNKLKQLIQMFEQLIGKIKSGECGSSELKTANHLCKSLEDLELNIVDTFKQEKAKLEEKIKAQQQKDEELAKQEQARQAEQEFAEAQKKQQQTPAPLSNANLESQNIPCKIQPDPPQRDVSNTSGDHESGEISSSKFVNSDRFEFYTKINNFYQEKVEKVKVLQSDESMKKYRFDCQKNINIPVNAISAVSQQHIKDKFDKLFTFVTAQPDLGRDYCILLMAKKFVGQGETTISSNPQAAFPVAAVIVSLWKNIPEFGQIFLAYVFKECPFLVPYFIPQKKGQSLEEYSKVLGYRLTDGQIEQQGLYLKRQMGVARLYAAVMITNGRQQDNAPHPYGLQYAWCWLTNFIALEPLPDICATLILEVLQILGSELWSTYGKQFAKLLVFIQQHYFPKLSVVDEGGPKARLELLLSKFFREGQIQQPQGILPQGFW